MMNRKWTTLGILPLCLLLLSHSITYAQQKKEITFRDIWEEKVFEIKDVPGFKTLENGQEYSRLDVDTTQSINIYRLADGKKLRTVFVRPDSMASIDKYSFSKKEDKLLLFTGKKPVYRRSALYCVWIYDIKQQRLLLLNKDKVLHATFNPQGTKVAFVKHNNLFIYDIASGYLTKVTTDGLKNHIINGNCDWVYEEEFGFTKAFQWSPDGTYLAYYRFDESRVKDYTLFFYDDSTNYPRAYTYKYPKAGEDNSIVTIHIYDLQREKSFQMETGSHTDQYIPRIKWTPAGNNLCIYRLNRHQNKLELLLQNARSPHSTVIYTEKNKYYIEINDYLTFLPNGHSLILNSERSGYNHLYLWDWKAQKLSPLTQGTWDVKTLVGIDPENKRVYYTAGKETPLQQKLYRTDFKGSASVCLTPRDGFHKITACKGNRYFLDEYSTANQVPVFRLIDASGKTVRVLEDNQALAKTMSDYAISPIRFLKIPNDQGVLLNAWMIRPPDFDSTQQYPVLMFQYSGPGSQEVLDKFPAPHYFWHQMMAEKGYVIVCVDGTGTGGRGWAFQNKTYLNLGKYESEDQMAAAKYLAALPYIDRHRIGIWGWSFGGFISATCILKGADVFKTAVAVAPVTNWRYYDNIYTERYMRLPAENEKGYDENAPANMASLLKGNFLIIHGLADDNVHFQNTAMLVKHLVEHNKDFQTEFYPNKNHSIYGAPTREQLFRSITTFLLEKL